jgi:hypothetical protein
MGIMRSIVKFLTNPKPVSTLAALEEGRAIIEGTVRKGSAGTLVSPVKGQPCVGFYYHAFHVVTSRAGQMARPLRTEERFHGFELELEDGRIVVQPRKPGTFTVEEHREMFSAGYEGFRATEEIIPLGTKVRLHGVAKKRDGSWTLTYANLEIIEMTVRADRGRPRPSSKRRAKY